MLKHSDFHRVVFKYKECAVTCEASCGLRVVTQWNDVPDRNASHNPEQWSYLGPDMWIGAHDDIRAAVIQAAVLGECSFVG
ncbi:hypothetical protein J6590_026219 [Homalodisca vitripennis]|nr:hypothetical protein J6590_026219 [Homalodisca vitripennis]